jgi:hypothetical protein
MIESITANAIAENLLAQVDAEGHRQLMIDKIIDHRSDATTIQKKDRYIINKKNNTKCRKLMTRGWELCVIWKDGLTNWILLKDLKDSYPVELA